MLWARCSSILINAATERAGRIFIKAADPAGDPIPALSFDEAVPIAGDQVWTQVTRRSDSDIGIQEGEPVELRFCVNAAPLDGLAFK